MTETSAREQMLEAALKDAKARLQEQDEFLQKLLSAPLMFGLVLRTNKQHTVIVADGKALRRPPPSRWQWATT